MWSTFEYIPMLLCWLKLADRCTFTFMHTLHHCNLPIDWLSYEYHVLSSVHTKLYWLSYKHHVISCVRSKVYKIKLAKATKSANSSLKGNEMWFWTAVFDPPWCTALRKAASAAKGRGVSNLWEAACSNDRTARGKQGLPLPGNQPKDCDWTTWIHTLHWSTGMIRHALW